MSPAGTFAVRHYLPPDGPETNAALVYAHGGGWVVGDLAFEDLKLKKLCPWSGIDIISVDYSLAPEHSCPILRNDVANFFLAFESTATQFNVVPSQLGLVGSSAVANLALSTALVVRNRASPLAAILLFYGFFDLNFLNSSFNQNATCFGLEPASMAKFRRQYIGDDLARHDDINASPALDNIKDLTPVFANAVKYDPFLDDSIDLQERLRTSGVDCILDIHTETIHGFTAMGAVMPHADEAIKQAATWLRTRMSVEDNCADATL